jgi:hypothetical protein
MEIIMIILTQEVEANGVKIKEILNCLFPPIKANKEHVCSVCNGRIKRQEIYVLSNNPTCIPCQNLIVSHKGLLILLQQSDFLLDVQGKMLFFKRYNEVKRKLKKKNDLSSLHSLDPNVERSKKNAQILADYYGRHIYVVKNHSVPQYSALAMIDQRELRLFLKPDHEVDATKGEILFIAKPSGKRLTHKMK